MYNSDRRNSISSLKRAAHLSDIGSSRLPLPAATTKPDKKRPKKNSKKVKKQHTRLLQERCAHCQELYSEVRPPHPGGRSLDEPMYLLYFSLRTSWALVGIPLTLFVVVSSVCLVFPAPNVFSITVTTRMKTFQVLAFFR